MTKLQRDIASLTEHARRDARVTQAQYQQTLSLSRSLKREICYFRDHSLDPVNIGTQDIAGVLRTNVAPPNPLSQLQRQLVTRHHRAKRQQLDEIDDHAGAVFGFEH